MTTWLRAQKRAVAIVALFALALQIVGTFGHVHVPKPSGVSAIVHYGAAGKAPFAHTRLPADHGAATIEPGQLPSSGDGDTLCPICLAGNLVASAIAASVPVLALPIAYLLVVQLRSAFELAPTDILTSFWCRGPPFA